MKIKDAKLIKDITGAEKIPVSNGTDSPVTVKLEQIKNYINSAIVNGEGVNSAILKGGDNISTGELSTALGRRNKSTGVFSYSEGEFNIASGARAHAEGCYTKAEGADSHAENEGCIARGINSHAEGYYTLASGITSHTEGASRADDPEYNPDDPAYATVEKYLEARGQRSHAEGYATQAFGNQSHAEGLDTLAEGTNSHAEGKESKALKNNSHAEGNTTISNAADSHAEGYKTQANGWASHSEGIETITNNQGEHACGKYNESIKSNSASDSTIFSIGIGNSSTRKNAFEVKANGDIYVEGVEGKIQDKLNQSIGSSSSTSSSMISVTYSELVNLRGNSQLVPGQQYRITDYLTTTTQENTQSAGHQFDIIVTADAVNILNENARAIQHEGDTYFLNSNLSAWELKYCLDNDTNKFAWPDTTNGKGVIYYMKDEWNNECPYDFKNIQFARWELSNPVGYKNNFNFDTWQDNWSQESTPFDSLKTGFYGLNGSTTVFNHGYNDDYEHYKYKVEYTISESPTYCYTFGKGTDYSSSGSSYGNVIKEYKNSNNRNKIQLNNIVFLNNGCRYNSFGYDCYLNSFASGNHNTFSNYCNSNSFGSGCASNSFGYSFSKNSFGNNCSYNSFGESCRSNTLGNSCSSNTFCYSCNNNTFSKNCSSNSLGDNGSSNSFGSDCEYNSFGKNCSYNSFGTYCRYNIFGNTYVSNSLGDTCSYNNFGSYCRYNTLGDTCSSNTFGESCSYNTFGESSTNPKSYYRYIIFDNGNCNINLNCTSETDSSNYYQNVRIGLGVNNKTPYKTITDSNIDQTYQTVYKPAESKELTA